jgi:elongation factor Ts
MTVISASLVKELRDETGAGMMDCKRALEETGGDLEAAKRLLREKGMAQAGKRAGRATTEGLVRHRVPDERDHGTMVAVGCETEPVAKNDEFRAFAEKVLELVDANGVGAEQELEAERVELVAKLGENVTLAGAARFVTVDGSLVAAYLHPPANKLGTLVNLGGGSPELGRALAMHIAWFDPRWISREDVPEDVVSAERDILMSSEEVQSKPEQARERIVDGMMNKRFFAERGGVLLDQPWIHEQSKTVAQALAEEGAQVLEFERFALGA